MNKTVIIDIDNTLWQFCDAFYEELKKVNYNFRPQEYWTDWAERLKTGLTETFKTS